MNNSTTRFSNRVEEYVKYRPSYPQQIIAFLREETGLKSSFVIADIGSGTGILSKLFLDNGNTVYGVEPNAEMRRKADDLLNSYPSFISIDGTAERTRLADRSMDMIVAGQAFHWFEPEKTKVEFKRVARENAYCVLIWNERLVRSSFEREYENLLLEYAIDYKEVNHKNIGEDTIATFFSPNDFTVRIFPNKQIFDFNGLKGRLLSSSYVPDKTYHRFPLMIEALNKIFHTHQNNNLVEFDYETKLYAGKL